MKITAIIAVIVLVGGGGVAAATYAGQVDWDDYFSRPGQYIDYKENWYGQTYSVIHTNAAKGDDGLYYAVTKFEFHDCSGSLVINGVNAVKEEHGYTFTWTGGEGGGSVYIPEARLAESTMYGLPNLNDHSDGNRPILQQIYDRYGIAGNPQIVMEWQDDHFELYYGYWSPPDGRKGDGGLIDSDFDPPHVALSGNVYIISDINKIEVQHVAESKSECDDQIYSAERFFNRVAEANALRLAWSE